MLKRRSIRKILATSSVLVALFLVCLIPRNKEYSLSPKQKIEYVNTEKQLQVVYLLDQNEYVARTKVVSNIKNVKIEDKAKELLEVLINNGKSEGKIPSGFKSIIPSDTKIISIAYEDGLIKVNFSNELLEIKQEYEEKMIEAIVYTLTSIENINNVVIYVNGDILTKLPKTKINLPSTLDRSYGINKKYELKNVSDYQKVTIYYINEYSDQYYYVPVTKYLNDSRDKIKIIIDELSSGPGFNTNLMSFLNSNTKLLSSEQNEDVLNLTFNNYIFNDADEKEILEEVIYTISLSVLDNYNIKEVNFKVKDQEIYKSVLKTLE